MAAELEFLQSLIDADEQPVFALDRELRYTAFNLAHAAAMRRLYGAEIALGGHLADYQTVAADSETAQENLRRALAGERVVASAFSGDEGRQRFFEVVHTPRASDDGSVIGVIVRAREVTTPRDREHLYAAFFENSLEGFAYCRMLYDDAGQPNDFTYLAVNPAFEQLTGLTDVVGRRITQLLPTVSDEAAEIFEIYGRVVETGEPAEFEVDFAPLARWLRISASRPEPGHFVAVFGDITETKQADDALRKTEAMRDVAESIARVGSVTWDLATQRATWSPEMFRLFAVEPEQFDGDSSIVFEQRMHPDDRERLEEATKRALATGRISPSEFSVVWPDGSTHVLHGEGTTDFDADGKPVAITGYFQDVTEQRRAEAALRETERMRDLAESIAGSGSWRWERGTHRVSLSPGMFRLFDLAPADFDGDVVKVVDTRLHPEDKAALLRAMGAFDETGVVPSPAQVRVVHRHGAEHILQLVSCAETSDDTGVTSLVGYFQDVTERRAADVALRTSEARLNTIFSAAHDAMVLLARDGRVLAFNARAEEMTGLSAATITGRQVIAPDFTSIHEDGTPWIREERPSLQTLRTGRPQQDVIMGLKHGEDVRWVSMNTAPVFRRGEDDASAVVVTFADVTDRRRAAEEIRRLNAELAQRVVSRTEQRDAATKELEAFAYSVAHDVRTPLRTIDGFSAAVLETDGERLSAESIQGLERARLAAQRMARLLDDLLGLSRVSRMDLLRTRVDLSALAREIGAELAAQHPERSVELVVADGMAADADRALVRMILLELLANAWKFTGKHAAARIEVAQTDGGGERVFFVRDDGAGFEMRYADHLFGAFQRMHPSDDFDGHGIGLATVQRLVIRHGGRVWAEAAVERGATFFFTLQGPAAIA